VLYKYCIIISSIIIKQRKSIRIHESSDKLSQCTFQLIPLSAIFASTISTKIPELEKRSFKCRKVGCSHGLEVKMKHSGVGH